MMTFVENYWDALVEMFAEMAPYLILGFFFAGLLKAFVPKDIYRRHLAPRTFGSVVKAAALGVPLPLCSCGVIPTAVGLKKEGASNGACASFLIATPQTGVDSILATYSFMGLPFAVIRPIVALLTAVFGGWLVNSHGEKDEHREHGEEEEHNEEHEEHCCCHNHNEHNEHEHSEHCHCHDHDDDDDDDDDCCCCHHEKIDESSFWKKFCGSMRYAFVEMLQDVGKWLLIGLLIAALITVAVPDEWLAALHDYKLLNMLIVLLIAIPMYTCATGSIPIAVSLMAKGLTPGAALVLLMAGPAVNSASMLVIGKVFGKRTLWLYLLSIVIGAVGFGLAIDYLLPAEWFAVASSIADGHCEHGLSVWDWIWSGAFVLLLINAFARTIGKEHCCEHD